MISIATCIQREKVESLCNRFENINDNNIKSLRSIFKNDIYMSQNNYLYVYNKAQEIHNISRIYKSKI